MKKCIFPPHKNTTPNYPVFQRNKITANCSLNVPVRTVQRRTCNIASVFPDFKVSHNHYIWFQKKIKDSRRKPARCRHQEKLLTRGHKNRFFISTLLQAQCIFTSMDPPQCTITDSCIEKDFATFVTRSEWQTKLKNDLCHGCPLWQLPASPHCLSAMKHSGCQSLDRRSAHKHRYPKLPNKLNKIYVTRATNESHIWVPEWIIGPA